MTKIDFIIIAKTLNNLFHSESWQLMRNSVSELYTGNIEQYIIGAFIAELMKVNKRFDADKFQKACYEGLE